MKHFFRTAIAASFVLLFSLNGIAQIEYSIADSRDFILDGAKLHDDEKYEEAIAEYSKVNRNDTNYVLALLEIANSYIALKKDSIAVAICDKALKIPSKYEPNLIILKANALDNWGRSEESLKLYQEGMKRFPYNNSFYYEQGVLHYRKENYKDAHDWVVKSIKVNPYHLASHNLMANLAIKQGKLIPAMLAWEFYLLLDNSTQRAKQIISALEKLAKNEYEFKDVKKVEPLSSQDEFEELESLVKSRIALTPKYKSKIKLPFDLVKQMQLIAEKIEVEKGDKGFYMQYYAPFLKELYKSKNFEAYVYATLSNMGSEKVDSWNKKNKSKLDAMATWAGNYINKNLTTQEVNWDGEKATKKAWYTSSKVAAIGEVDATQNPIGYWKYYYISGVTKSEGKFNNGKRTGLWKFYYPTGTLKETAVYVDGEIEGENIEYYSNGSVNMKKIYKKSLLDGMQYLYHPTGVLKGEYDYKAGVQSGKEVSYYKNGKKKYEATLANDKYEGEVLEYYESGRLMKKSVFVGGFRTGHATSYFDNAESKIKWEGDYLKDNVTGPWKYYFDNGKIEEEGSYDNEGYKQGIWKVYNKQGVLLEEESFSAGKFDGVSKYYDKKGKIIEMYVYKKDILQEYKAYDGNDKIVFENKKDGRDNYDVLLYHPTGNKKMEGRISKGLLVGNWKNYNINGYLESEVTYEEGRKHGTSIQYHDNGKIYSIVEYDKGSTTGIYKQYYKNGTLKREGPYIKGEQQGQWRSYSTDGTIYAILYYKDDELDGWQEYYAVNGKLDNEELMEFSYLKRKVYYDSTGNVKQAFDFEKGTGPLNLNYLNGQPNIKGNMKNGALQGEYTTYFGTGKLRSTRFFEHGNLEGEFKFYYTDGKVEAEYIYHQDEKNGPYKSYYENGNIQKYTDYKMGDIEGKSITYYENKQVYRESEYTNDEMNGKSVVYAENGELIMDRTFENDRMISYTYLDKTGNPAPTIHFKNGTGDVKAYFKNGNPSIEYYLKNSALEGKRTTYHPNGKPYAVEHFYCGAQDSVAYTYYASGQLKEESNWLLGDLHGRYITYHPNGKKESEGFYKNDYKHGTFKFYDATGKLIKTRFYYDGDLLDEK